MAHRDDPRPTPLEYGKRPSLQEKIDRFLSETHRQGVREWTAAPPFMRLVWRLKLGVPPPLYWSFGIDALISGFWFAVLFSLIMVFVFGEEWRRQLVSTPIAAVIFGLGMAWYTRRVARRLKLTPWDGRTSSGA